ncbi:MAG: adenine/guanine/hypoxanthine permease [Thermosediminibacterales bacterium]|nr:adenine/guanine/hypoxanthine permease [Thermosediminibacterales bacterium]MDK2835327.1 adenine/guanine/hypoxanthine permease [Thermosediminibacterales bacterium]
MLEKIFKLKENGTTVKTEVIAGFTTFITMAYIIFVNPSILRMAGMNSEGALGDAALKFNAFNDPVVGAVMVATVLSAALATFIMGVYANYPFALAPGMGLNAFFTFTVVLTMGLSWQTALGAVFISGLVFIIITVTGIREAIVNAIPLSLKNAVSAGIGLFIALIGFVNAKIVVSNPATVVGLGNFTDKKVLLALIGLVITGILMARRVKGAILLGILITTAIGIPMGVVTIGKGFSPVSMPPSLAPTLFKLNFEALNVPEGGRVFDAVIAFIAVILSFTYVDLFDTLGTLVGTGAKAGMLDKEGKLPRINKAMMADAVGTSVGALLGTSTVTTYVESTAGIMEGGKTGLTSVVVSLLFLVSLFLAPVAGLVPAEATAPALIIVGVLMMGAVREIDFSDFTEALPAFITIVAMPFSYSIANGIAAGLIFYPIVKIVAGRAKEVHPIVYVLALLFIIRFATLAS